MRVIDRPPERFITLEGPDGAGKSSQAARLAERVERETGREVVLAREPGGTALGERVRQVVLAGDVGGRDPLTDALLFNAARRQIVAEVIAPALVRGAIVVCDRFADSTLAYQGYGSGVPLDALRTLAEVATGGLVPHRTVLLDLPAATGLARRHAGASADLTRFEMDPAHGVPFHERVRRGYLELARAEPGRWRIVNAAASPETVQAAVWEAVSDLFAA
jgi:dTMP kinase